MTRESEAGYDYLGAPQVTTPGLLTVSSQQYQARVSQETMRFFNVRNEQVSTTEYSHLTPAILKVDNKVFKNFRDENVDDIIKKLKVIYEDYWKRENQINTSIKLPLTIAINILNEKNSYFMYRKFMPKPNT